MKPVNDELDPHADPHAHKGGSYIAGEDGVRRLAERTEDPAQGVKPEAGAAAAGQEAAHTDQPETSATDAEHQE